MRAACVLAALVASSSSEAADITYETRALTGTDGPLGPQLGAGVFFSSFDLTPPVLNSAGQVAFKAFLTGAGVDSANSRGVWADDAGAGLRLVARAGSQAPDTDPGVYFDNFSEEVGIDASGQTAFIASLVGVGVDVSTNGSGIWSEGGGSGLTLVARRGDPAPGFGPDVVFSGFFTNDPVFNSVGQTAFFAAIVGPGVTFSNNDGVWSEGAGSGPQIIAREAEQAPGTDPGVNFGQFKHPVLNNLGQAAFSAPLTGAGVDASNDTGIWSQGGGAGLQLIAREGDQAPGTDPGVYFGDFDFMGTPNDPAINDAGHTAFRAYLTGAGVVDFSNNIGIWSDGGGSGLQLIARTGSQAPDTDPGVNFRTLRVPVINAAGQTAFTAFIEGPGVDSTNDSGIWTQGPSGLQLIVRKGSQAPGADPGVVLRSTGSPAFNSHGQIAFFAFLEGPGVDSSNNSGVWATDLDGGLHMIAREGDLFDVSNDPLNPDMRTVFDVDLVIGSGGEDGRRASLNDNGQLAFWIEFEDPEDYSEGVFVATIGGPSATPFKLTITPAIAPATGYDLAWVSQPGKVYNLLTSPDLATPIAEWPVHASYGDIPATGTTTRLPAVQVDGPQRFFVVLEKDAPLAD